MTQQFSHSPRGAAEYRIGDPPSNQNNLDLKNLNLFFLPFENVF